MLVWLLGSGLAEFDAAVVMTRWMFPYIGCMSLVALAAGVLNTWRRFIVPAATPVLLNLSMIAAGALLAPAFAARGIEPIYALAIGRHGRRRTPAGGAAAGAAPHRRLPAHRARAGAIRSAWRHPGVSRVLRLMAPALLGVSVAQLSLLINTQIATHVAVGAVSWLFYADRLMEFPTALLGVALGVILLPQLAGANARADAAVYSGLLDWGLRLSLLLALPCAAALLVFPQPLIAVLFHHGQFTAQDVHMTVSALRGYGVGLVGIIGVKVLAPGFYARQDIRTPVRIALAVLAATQLMNLAFVPLFGHAGLALAIGVGALVNAGWLLVGLRRSGAYRPAAGWWPFLARVVGATALLALLLAWAAGAVDWIGLAAASLAARRPAGRRARWRGGDLLRCAPAVRAAPAAVFAPRRARIPTGDSGGVATCRRTAEPLHCTHDVPAIRGAHGAAVLRIARGRRQQLLAARGGSRDRAGRIPQARSRSPSWPRSTPWPTSSSAASRLTPWPCSACGS